jgi:hypothetical protein
MQRLGIFRLKETRMDALGPDRVTHTTRRQIEPHAKHLETRRTRHNQSIDDYVPLKNRLDPASGSRSSRSAPPAEDHRKD